MTRSVCGEHRILLVTPNSPFLHASGAEQRSALMLQALQRLGRVDVLQLSPDTSTRIDREDNQSTRFVRATLAGADRSLKRYHPKADFTRGIETALEMPMASYDLIVGRYLWPICQLVFPSQVPSIVDLDDFQFRFSPLISWSVDNLGQRLAKRLARILAHRQLGRFMGYFAVSQQDRGILRRMGIQSAEYLPNVPIGTFVDAPSIVKENTLLFVGSLWYGPNIEAVNWFLKCVWPSVLQHEPSAKLVLVGAAPKSRRAAWETHPEVLAPGFVDDLGEAYRQAKGVIVPVLSGGGTNIKVLEALARGKPCIVSNFVAEAFGEELQPGTHYLVADGAESFVRHTLQVLGGRDTDLRVLATAGQDRVRDRFTPEAFHTTVQKYAGGFMPGLRLGADQP